MLEKTNKKNLFFKSGFTLVEAIISIALISAGALGMMKVTQMQVGIKSSTSSDIDYLNLQNEVNIYLTSATLCQDSFEGVTFSGSTINASPVDIELRKKLSDGAYDTRLSAVGDPGLARYGSLKMSSMKLSIPEYIEGDDFAEDASGRELLFKIKIDGEKKISAKSVRNFRSIERRFFVTFTTDDTGLSTVISCYMFSTDQNDLPTTPQNIVNADSAGSPYSLAEGDFVFSDTSSGGITLNLPLNPQIGDQVKIIDINGSANATNPITVNPGVGKKILGQVDGVSMQIDTPNFSSILVYTDNANGWVIY